MKRPFHILIIGLLLQSINTQSFAQADTSNNLVDKHWQLVKDAHLKFLETTIRFCSLDQIKSKDPKTTEQLTKKSNEYLTFLKPISILDSSIAVKVDSLSFSLLGSLTLFLDKIQKDKALFNQSAIRQEAKKLEYDLENIERQIHSFNYWVYEKNKAKIKFKDINL